MALIGIIIGTAAVIALLHVSYTAKTAALRQFDGLGTDIMIATPQPSAQGRPAQLTSSAVIGALDSNTMVESFSQINFLSDTAYHHWHQAYSTIIAADSEIFSISDATIKTGRPVFSLDGDALFTVIGYDLAVALGVATQADPIGAKITLNGGQVLVVVGVLNHTAQNMILGLDLNNSFVIPTKAIHRLADQNTVDAVAIRVRKSVDAMEAAIEIERALNSRMSFGTVRVTSAAQLIASVNEQMRIYSILLIGIGFVATIVGGVGIMNVMLFSVIERRQEIGLRRAIGASQLDIRFEFLVESLLLSLLGGVVGTVLGYAGGWGFSFVSGTAFTPSPMAIPLGLTIALTVGLAFGMIPAIRASKLDPIEALRGE